MNWRLVRLFNVDVSIHPLFLLFMGLWLLAGLPLETLFLFALVVGHELTHLVTARHLGIPVTRVALFPFGGVGYLSNPIELEPRKEIMVAAAGPLFNGVCFALLWSYAMGPAPSWTFLEPEAVSFLLRANLFLFLFNLLPALPLDGGRLFRALLSSRRGFYKATEVASNNGKWLGAGFLIAGLILSRYDYMHLSISFMGMFLYYTASMEQQASVYTFIRYLVRKEKALQQNKILKGEQLVALDTMTVSDVLKQFKPNRYHQVVVLNQTCRVLAFLSESQILETVLKNGPDVPLKLLIYKQAGPVSCNCFLHLQR